MDLAGIRAGWPFANVQIALAIKGGGACPSMFSTPGSHRRTHWRTGRHAVLQLQTIAEHAAYSLLIAAAGTYSSGRHGHDGNRRRNEMDRNDNDDVIDLGSASAETKGGAMGYEDQERTKWLNGLGLADD